MNIVCWGEPESQNNTESNTVTAEFHFNYWPKSISDHQQKTPYLDIGVKLHSYNGLKNLCFWFPSAPSKKCFLTKFFRTKPNKQQTNLDEIFQDLGSLFANANNELATLIFNESISISSDANKPKQLIVTNLNTQNTFIIYELTKENLQMEHSYDGDILRISLDKLKSVGNTNPIYIRFRLKGDFLKCIERVIKTKNKLFQSAFTETSYIDFRFNDTRSMSKPLREHFLNPRLVTLIIPKVHFLLMTRSDEELTTPSNINARILEPNTWEPYLGHQLCNVCVANHWRFTKPDGKNTIENCIIYGCYKIHHCNFITIGLYTLILFLMTLCFNTISATVYGYLQLLFPSIFH